MPWAYGMLAARTFYPADGITAMDLAFNCQLQYYYPPAQSVNTLVLTCPMMEMMRLWPLPVGPVNTLMLAYPSMGLMWTLCKNSIIQSD